MSEERSAEADGHHRRQANQPHSTTARGEVALSLMRIGRKRSAIQRSATSSTRQGSHLSVYKSMRLNL